MKYVLPMFLITAALGGCYMEVHDEKNGAGRIGGENTDSVDAQAPREGVSACEEGVRGDYGQCFENEDFTWRTSCKKASCQEVKVFAHYMLKDERGENQPVQVEAFDNPYFLGAPSATVALTHFSARPGFWQDVSLYLEPGEYYLRAYMTSGNEALKPYQFGGMTLVQNAPVGVYGALSGAEMLRVAPRAQNPYPAPVHIYLDREFKDPSAEPATNAHIRFALALAEGTTAPDGREVRIRLHHTTDLDAQPVYEFAMPTELLLVTGRVGRADYLTPELEEGDYIAYVYIDANGNKLHDDGELGALYKQNGQPFAVHVAKDRTVPVELTLAADPVL